MTRVDGYAPIADYAAIGDGRTVALIAQDGSIDWLPIPALNAPPLFHAILDAEGGGAFTLRPTEPFRTSRRYIPDTNVLETTFQTASGTARVTDCLAVGTAGRLPWGELSRRVEAVSGAVPMRWSVAPGERFGAGRPWAAMRDGVPIVTQGDQHLAVLAFDAGEPRCTGRSVEGEFTAGSGGRSLLTIAFADGEPIFVPHRGHIEDRIDRTVDSWRSWSERMRYEGPWAAEVRRSALALKLLLYSPTGAVAAAPTTSLPERIGGARNWDYRYMWIRDSAFTVDALIQLGLHEEVHGALSWLLSTVRRTAHDIHVFYTLDGDIAETEDTMPMPGYRWSQPVRNGNSAARQQQLGNFGDLLESVWLYVQQGNLLDDATAHVLARLADRVCNIWSTRDSGIWELDEHRHYTISKVGCWVALDRTVRLAERGQVSSRHVDRWRFERDSIRRWVDEHCWSADKNSYTFYAGSDELDAATLLTARNGFLDPDDKRLSGTIDAVRRGLAEGSLVYRYDDMRTAEGAFVACSFWLAEALAVAGRTDEAAEVMSGALAAANDVGLFAEEIDPSTGEFLGNFPQGLSHLSLINAAGAIAAADRGEDPRTGTSRDGR